LEGKGEVVLRGGFAPSFCFSPMLRIHLPTIERGKKGESKRGRATKYIIREFQRDKVPKHITGSSRGAKPLFLLRSPSPRVERGIKGVRLINNLLLDRLAYVTVNMI